MDWMRAFGDPATLDPQANINYSPSKDTDALEPKWSAGIGEGLIKALPSAYYQSLSAFNDLASAVPYNEDLAAREDPLSDLPPQTQTDREKIQARMDADAKFARLKVKNEWTPNPETTGTAGQIVHGLTSSLAKAIGYSFAGGPFVGGAMYGADIGAYEAGKLRDQGVDASTAKLSGFASGATNAVGLALPAALGTNYFKSALFGAAVNPLTDISERGAINFILDNANYTEISKEYDPFDPTMLTTSALLGGAFGALGARANRVKVEQLAKDIKEHAPIAQAEQEPRLKQDVLDSIQNRDRTGKESKLQMASIARSPDFNRLRESRNLNEGAPVIAYVPESANIVYGKRVEVSDSEGNRYPMRYAVIEANDVLTSNSVDGSANPQFTDVNTDKARAIAGNGRVAGLQGAYRDVHATDYRAELTQDSKQFGISRGRVKKMENPILVRVMDDSDVTVGIGEKSNRSGIAKLTPEEQAAQDARNVDLDEVEFRADGDITVQSMDYFVARTPDKEGLVDHQGNTIYDQVRNRMRAAIFASAFQDTRLINRFISGTQKEKQILDVLMNAAPEIVRLRRMGADYDFSEDVVNAVADIFQTRQETKGKIQGEQTQSLFEGTEAQQYFKDILLSDEPGKINKVLERIREVVHAEGQENFFGDKITAQDIFNFVRDEFGAFKRVVDSITQEDVDAAMVLKSANTIQGDQPSGKNGNLNKSIEAEKTAREQIDNGETVSVNTDGVDPEKLDKDVSNFVTRFVKELVGAGADKKIAEMDARVIGAFYRSFGARSGRNIEQEYGVKVRAGGDADSEAGYLQTPKGGGGPRGIYTPGERVITLMYSADESTFVHEAGHYFLDVLTDVGKRSDVPEQIRNDIQTLMDWFGVKDLKEWDSLSIDEKRAHHEQFSRGFEQYLRDGEAPSLNLKAVFDAFKNWLRSIYKSSQELNIEISPEVRGVYDRLLATDEEIRAKQEADQPSMFNFDEAPQRTPQEAVTQLIEEAPIPDEAKTIVKRTLGIEDQKTQESAKKGIPNDNEFIDQSIESAVQRDPSATVIDENGNEISIKEFLANSQKELEDDMKFADGMSKAAECMWQNGAFDFL